MRKDFYVKAREESKDSQIFYENMRICSVMSGCSRYNSIYETILRGINYSEMIL
ncbi:hypothetical protein APHNP_0127 [Anaplasma phagocytophilum str. ApNP]|uniref:Uncharacterized protein n=1 Tax=Anaplasma phagocytophilum str. ApNP TaxID=1359153 RepID=A0A0F3NI18_ANAPH|nr:hypothetical protein APHNP_0127 [Anaplasma phagocytophilum str. ApNP]